MQVNNKSNPEQSKKLKGIIARNQEIGDKINNDTLGSKIEASVKHSAGTGLKTSATAQKDISPAQKHATVQQLKSNHKNATHSNTENSIENSSPLISKEDAGIKKNVQKINYVQNVKNTNRKKTINVKAKKSNKPDNIPSELQNKADLAKMAVQKKKKTEIKSKINRHNTVITKKVNRNTEITNSVKRKVISNRRKIKSTPNFTNKNTKINYAKTLAMRKRQVKYVQQRRIKTAVRAQQNHTNLTIYNNAVSKANPKTIRTRYNSAIKNRVKRNETISRKQNKIIHSRNRSGLKTGQVRAPRLIKVRTIRVVGNLKAVRKIKLSKRIYKAIIGKLRLKLLKNSKFRKFLRKATKAVRIMKVVSGYVKYGVKEVASPILAVGKKAISLGADALNNAAKNVNYDDISDTGIESLKFMYKNASDAVSGVNTTRHIATGVNRTIRTGYKTAVKVAEATPGTIRSIPGKVRQVARTGRKIKTNAKRAVRTTKRIVGAFKKGGAKAAAKEAAKVAKKVADVARKATIEAFKLIVKAVELIISNLPVILIAVAVIIIAMLLIQGIGALVSAVSGTIEATLNWAFPEYESSEPLEIESLLKEYDKYLEEGLKKEREKRVDEASSYLTEDDDYYAVITNNGSLDWIPYSGGAGASTVMERLNSIEPDKTEFYALLFVYKQKINNEADGNGSDDIYDISFTSGDISGFINQYYDITITFESGLSCPGKNCHTDTCSDVSSCTNRGSQGVPVIDPETGEPTGEVVVVYYCKGHPYCDNEHKKSTITWVVNSNVTDDLGFTQEEKERVDIVEQMFEDVILGDVMGVETETPETT